MSDLNIETRKGLAECQGIIHVGANSGQERDLYAEYRLDVLWFEPNPEVFVKLQANIAGLPKQRAYQFLVTDQNDAEYTLHVANNEGQSSSIFDFQEHSKICPAVHYTGSVEVKSITLDTFMKRQGMDPAGFQKLHVDAQGSDLLALKGAVETLKHVKYIQVEVSSLMLYAGGCLESEITAFLASQGFREDFRSVFVGCLTEGTWSEIIYKKDTA